MAKIVITLEDMENGAVRTTIEPNFATLAKLAVSGRELTSAQGYALCAVNAVRKASKQSAGGDLAVPLPRLKGRFYR